MTSAAGHVLWEGCNAPNQGLAAVIKFNPSVQESGRVKGAFAEKEQLQGGGGGGG